jgi:uncharacterized protein (DUF4415 family)
MPSVAEDREIIAAAKADPDARPLTNAQLAQMVPAKALRGRPPLATRKQLVSVRYSPEVLAYFRSTGAGWQARWIIEVSQALQPLVNLARDHLLACPVIHMDETRMQVLKEPDRAASALSYMWVHIGGPPGKRVVLFDYETSRSAEVPERLSHPWQSEQGR